MPIPMTMLSHHHHQSRLRLLTADRSCSGTSIITASPATSVGSSCSVWVELIQELASAVVCTSQDATASTLVLIEVASAELVEEFASAVA